jgi:hypothetical protein
MKYLENGRFRDPSLMRLTLGGALVFLFALWVSAFGLYFSRMSLSPTSVVSYYRGSEETFQPARTFGSMVEVTHGHMAMMALVLLLLTHLAIFIPAPRRLKAVGIVGTFAAAFANELSGWLVRFASPAFAALKPVAFLTSQGFQLLLLASLAVYLFRPERKVETGATREDALGDQPETASLDADEPAA